MCVSSAAADFRGTTLYAGRRDHPEHGPIEVLGYQNTAVNLSDGPNAMLLHLPAADGVGFVPVGRSGDVLARMRAATEPALDTAAMDWMSNDEARFSIFEHDVYTVVLAADPMSVPAALHRVPPRKRPSLRPELFTFYADVFPLHTIALCCFDNAEAQIAKPLLLRYRPIDPDLVHLPGIDSHTGEAPDLDADVDTDHWLVFGTDDPDWGAHYDRPPGMRHELRSYLPASVRGLAVEGRHPNGDFVLTLDDLRAGAVHNVRRMPPDH
ncbi:MAG: hypothetical protein HOY78_21695 [Saccharothrix sp.]|nr:hypothetical protein [Saccharothrix sp.]